MKLNCLNLKKERKYKVGDFSFIKNPVERASMDFDYRVFRRIHKVQRNGLHSRMNYSDESYSSNIKNISFIEKHGWDIFVKSYTN
jgi:hypothetical protein